MANKEVKVSEIIALLRSGHKRPEINEMYEFNKADKELVWNCAALKNLKASPKPEEATINLINDVEVDYGPTGVPAGVNPNVQASAVEF